MMSETCRHQKHHPLSFPTALVDFCYYFYVSKTKLMGEGGSIQLNPSPLNLPLNVIFKTGHLLSLLRAFHSLKNVYPSKIISEENLLVVKSGWFLNVIFGYFV